MVTLAQLTYSFDLSDADQWVASSFAGSVGPWTDEEAGTLVEAWDRIHEPVAPKFPEGTPEHDDYVTELRAELAKWVRREFPYV